MYLEEIGSQFAALIVAADKHGAEIFAGDLAKGGATADNVYAMADAWDSCGFTPAGFSDKLRAFALDLDDDK